MATIQWAGTPNYSTDRAGKKIMAIVDHITAGSYPGCLNWLQNPQARASAHYLITKAGQIFQLVKDEDTAWHAGIVNKPNWSLYDGTNPNKCTIGIEHEGQPGDVFTEAQYQATLWLHKELIRKWGVPVDNDHIIGHYRLDSVNRSNCPGSGFPWERLFSDLKGSVAVDEGILIFGPDDFVSANRLAVTLGNEVAIFVRKSDGTPPTAIKTAKHLYVVGGSEVNHPNQTLLAGANWFATVAAVGKKLGY